MASVSLNHIYKVYSGNVTAVSDFCLDIEDKEFIVLVGPSGCGKTTLLNAIGGLDKVSSGKIYINGQRITRRRSAKIHQIRNLNIGYIFQN